MFTQSSKLFSNKNVDLKNGINLWVESFGNPKDTPILLIIGAGSQCKLWPEEFCKKLADGGYFVVRYDHRDTGKSNSINYQDSPYTIMDLSRDAIAVLDSFDIQSAHIVGFSMGGQIAQFIGAYFPEYAQTITLMATSTSFKEGFNAFEGKLTPDGLSPPKEHYVKWATRAINVDQQSLEEKIQDFLTSWKFLNGDKVAFDEELYKQMAIESYSRSELYNPYPNHALAMQASYEEHKNAPRLIKASTLIIHGKEDPVFGIDHAHSLNKEIQKSQLIIIDDMGHNLNTKFFGQIISLIKNHVNQYLLAQNVQYEGIVLK